MKYYYLVLLALACLACKRKPEVNTALLRNGDIIFQTSTSAQSQAIQLATHSKYSHCGIVFEDSGKWFVFEAIQPVTTTPLDNWIVRGEKSAYVIKRLKDTTPLTPEAFKKMKASAQKMTAKDYDLYFEWSNDRIYCSELVWKLYKDGTGLEVGKLKHLKDFDLSNAAVQQKMKERYGNTIPLDEAVISPAEIYESELLKTVIGVNKAP
ncbi:YiiX family permuted papain-like enzyme [Flavobacterium sp. RHBU_24]|uniref:YiiX family permuted papain-like enzyme n=1 Tax=Flavobacterium sp. RHBU_24 TaxID=3391185 RepID=UPI00398555E3